jgi:hypothetical protein
VEDCLGALVDELSSQLLGIAKEQRVRENLPLGIQLRKARHKPATKQQYSGDCCKRSNGKFKHRERQWDIIRRRCTAHLSDRESTSKRTSEEAENRDNDYVTGGRIAQGLDIAFFRIFPTRANLTN